MAIIVPAYLAVTAFATYSLTSMQATYPELTIVFPVVALVVYLAYSWPLSHRTTNSPT